METKKGKYDLIIVGGGLSASFLCLNILKSNSEFKILVIEKNERFPQKVGESFVDITALFVQSLGIDHLLKDQAVKTGVRYLFNETNSDNMDEIAEFASPTQPGRIKGYHVNRQLFDEQMIEEIELRGVDVLRPAKIISSIHKEFNNLFKVEVDNELHDIESRWVVDASGRSRFIAKKINWEIKSTKLNTGSIMTHIVHNSFSSDWDTPFGDIWNQKAIGSRDFATIHLMRKNAWWWIIRINNSTTSLGVVFDKNHHEVNDPDTFLKTQIQKDKQLTLLTKDCKIGAIKYIKDLSYTSDKIYAKGVALLGDSGAFLDPLFSPGLELISQQVLWLTTLLFDDKKSETFNHKDWNKYNNCFQKAYTSRIDLYKVSYKIMHSYNLFSSWLLLGNYFYYAKVVFPAVMFRKSLKSPLRFNAPEYFIFRLLGKRFSNIESKRSKQPSIVSLSNNICFSGIEVPTGKRFFIVPLLLLVKAIKSYLRVELKEITYKLSKRRPNHSTIKF